MEWAPKATGPPGVAEGTPAAFVTRNQRFTPIQTGSDSLPPALLEKR